MPWAFGVILISVLIGTVLALVPKRHDRFMGPVRTFALSAALCVVALHMLPESFELIGGWAFIALGIGLLLPPALGRGGSAAWRAWSSGGAPSPHLALEASYAGLLVHRVGDGVALGLYTGELGHGSHGGVAAALAAHAVPVVAIVVLTFDSVRGRGAALWRAGGMALASCLGVVATRFLPTASFAHFNGIAAAVVGGMLLHVVTHDLDKQLPSGHGPRVLDLGAVAAGVAVSWLGGSAHAHHEQAVEKTELWSLLGKFWLSVAPLLLLSWGLSILCLALLRRRGGALGGVAARLRSWQRWPGLDGLVLLLVFFGPVLALSAVGGAVLLAAVGRWLLPQAPASGGEAPRFEPPALEPNFPALRARFRSVVPWMLFALLLAGVSAQTFSRGASGVLAPPAVQLGIVVLALAFGAWPAAPVVVLVGILLSHGLSPGAALLAVWLLPIGVVRARAGQTWTRGRAGQGAWRPVALVCVSVGLAFGATRLSWLGPEPVKLGGTLWHVLSLLLAGLAGALVLLDIYTRGVRGFLLELPIGHRHVGGAPGHASGAPPDLGSGQPLVKAPAARASRDASAPPGR